MPSFIELVF